MRHESLKNGRRTGLWIGCLLALLAAPVGPALGADDLVPRVLPEKPVRVRLLEHHRDDVITVKFHDDLPVRVRDGMVTDLGTGVLNDAALALQLLAGGVWQPAHRLTEAKLAELRATPQANRGRAIADLNARFNLFPVGPTR